MQNRLNYSNAERNDTSITVHLQDSSHLVLFLTNSWFGAKWLIGVKIVYSVVKYCCFLFCFLKNWYGKYRLKLTIINQLLPLLPAVELVKQILSD